MYTLCVLEARMHVHISLHPVFVIKIAFSLDTEWSPEFGGMTSYIAKDEDEEVCMNYVQNVLGTRLIVLV